MKEKIESGNILIAQPFMEDSNFKRSVIGLTEHGEEGTVGFILNKPLNVKFSEIMPDLETEEQYRVYFGGPVAKDTIHYLHNVGDLLEESIPIKQGIYWGGNFEKLTFLIQSGLILAKNIRFYVGYAGWSEGQLDEELKGGTWIVSDWFANYTFQSQPKDLWQESLNHKGDTYSVISQISTKHNDN